MMNIAKRGVVWVLFAVLSLVAACQSYTANNLAMVRDPGTGLAFGSVINGSLLTDPSMYPNSTIKVAMRNTSGDVAFNLRGMKQQVESAYQQKGYGITPGPDFGIKVDVNVVFSGQVQTDMSREFGFLGAAAGGIQGYRSDTRGGAAIGTVTGATLGAVAGSFVRENTYIIVAFVNIGVRDKSRKRKKVVTFSRSEKIRDYEEDESYGRWRERASVQIAVYAGGTNVSQQRIADEVRQRIIRIVSDVI